MKNNNFLNYKNYGYPILTLDTGYKTWVYGSRFGHVFWSSDQGITWNKCDKNILKENTVSNIQCVVLTKNNEKYEYFIAYGDHCMSYSEDGKTWVDMNIPLKKEDIIISSKMSHLDNCVAFITNTNKLIIFTLNVEDKYLYYDLDMHFKLVDNALVGIVYDYTTRRFKLMYSNGASADIVLTERPRTKNIDISISFNKNNIIELFKNEKDKVVKCYSGLYNITKSTKVKFTKKQEKDMFLAIIIIMLNNGDIYYTSNNKTYNKLEFPVIHKLDENNNEVKVSLSKDLQDIKFVDGNIVAITNYYLLKCVDLYNFMIVFTDTREYDFLNDTEKYIPAVQYSQNFNNIFIRKRNCISHTYNKIIIGSDFGVLSIIGTDNIENIYYNPELLVSETKHMVYFNNKYYMLSANNDYYSSKIDSSLLLTKYRHLLSSVFESKDGVNWEKINFTIFHVFESLHAKEYICGLYTDNKYLYIIDSQGIVYRTEDLYDFIKIKENAISLSFNKNGDINYTLLENKVNINNNELLLEYKTDHELLKSIFTDKEIVLVRDNIIKEYEKRIVTEVLQVEDNEIIINNFGGIDIVKDNNIIPTNILASKMPYNTIIKYKDKYILNSDFEFIVSKNGEYWDTLKFEDFRTNMRHMMFTKSFFINNKYFIYRDDSSQPFIIEDINNIYNLN